MPRVRLNAREYKVKDFCSWVQRVAKEEHINQTQLGKAIGVSQSRVSAKLREGSFDLKEIIILLELLQADDDEVARLLLVNRR